MGSDIKLSYFNVRGRAETARLILAHAGVRYTDQRLTFDQFSTVKSKLPYGQLPTLKYDGEVVCQSISISRFLAKEFGLAGKDNIENAQCDEIVDAVNDIMNAKLTALRETNDDLKEEVSILWEIICHGLTYTSMHLLILRSQPTLRWL